MRHRWRWCGRAELDGLLAAGRRPQPRRPRSAIDRNGRERPVPSSVDAQGRGGKRKATADAAPSARRPTSLGLVTLGWPLLRRLDGPPSEHWVGSTSTTRASGPVRAAVASRPGPPSAPASAAAARPRPSPAPRPTRWPPPAAAPRLSPATARVVGSAPGAHRRQLTASVPIRARHRSTSFDHEATRSAKTSSAAFGPRSRQLAHGVVLLLPACPPLRVTAFTSTKISGDIRDRHRGRRPNSSTAWPRSRAASPRAARRQAKGRQKARWSASPAEAAPA